LQLYNKKNLITICICAFAINKTLNDQYLYIFLILYQNARLINVSYIEQNQKKIEKIP